MIISGMLIINPTLGLKSLNTAYSTVNQNYAMHIPRKSLAE